MELSCEEQKPANYLAFPAAIDDSHGNCNTRNKQIGYIRPQRDQPYDVYHERRSVLLWQMLETA